jgi:hypothetical protein
MCFDWGGADEGVDGAFWWVGAMEGCCCLMSTGWVSRTPGLAAEVAV